MKKLTMYAAATVLMAVCNFTTVRAEQPASIANPSTEATAIARSSLTMQLQENSMEEQKPATPAFCSTDSSLVGCVFSLHPMSDDYVEEILGTLDAVDFSQVWRETDNVSTTVRGDIGHVFDVVHAATAKLASTGTHVALSATFSIGCPGDSDVHKPEAPPSAERPNRDLAESLSRPVSAKFALYPMSGGNYMDTIYEQIEAIKSSGVKVQMVHYSTRLDGDLQDLFRGLESTLAATGAVSPHTIMTVNISANSPTPAP